MPDVSGLPSSYPDAPGFWIKGPGNPTTKNEGEAKCHPLTSSLLNVDIARELRSAQYSRDKARNKARFARAQESKRQDQPRRGHHIQRSRGGKRSGKRQLVPQDFEMGPETGCERNPSVFVERRKAVLAHVRMHEDRPTPTSIPPELQPPPKKPLKGFTPPDAYTTPTLPEPAFNIPAPDIAREFRSYERHRHQTKKNARYTQSRMKKGFIVKPVLNRSSKSVKTENLQRSINLAVIDQRVFSEDEIRTPIEVLLSPDVEITGTRAPLAVDMEALITTARVKYTDGSFKSLGLTTSSFLTNYDAEPGFEFVKSVPLVVALDGGLGDDDDDDEPWEHVWNDDLAD